MTVPNFCAYKKVLHKKLYIHWADISAVMLDAQFYSMPQFLSKPTEITTETLNLLRTWLSQFGNSSVPNHYDIL